MPIYMKIDGVRGTFDLAETDTLVFTGDDTGGTQAPLRRLRRLLGIIWAVLP